MVLNRKFSQFSPFRIQLFTSIVEEWRIHRKFFEETKSFLAGQPDDTNKEKLSTEQLLEMSPAINDKHKDNISTNLIFEFFLDTKVAFQ